MFDVQKYNRLKEINKKYGYGSWALWKENNPKNKDVSFFDEMENNGELFNQLTDKVMMLALNPSGNDNGAKPLLWKNFRGGKYDQRILMLVKEFKWGGCYITDLFKEKIGTSSKDAREQICEWEKNGKLKEKIEPFVNELNAIDLDSLDWIIVFGKSTTYEIVKDLVKDGFFPKKILGKIVIITHYSYRHKKCKNDEGYLECVKDQLKEQNIFA